MSETTLIEKIKKDATAIVAEVKSAGATEVEKIQREIETEVAELRKSHAGRLEKTKAQMELVAISKAKQLGKIAVQSVKRAQINSIFNVVLENLQNQSVDDYVTFFEKYITEVLPKDAEMLSVDVPMNREEETQKVLKAVGFEGKVKVDTAIKSGLVIHTRDGVYDVTLARLMNEKRAELEMLIVNQVMS